MSESYPTKINPILYNRLHFAVEGLASGVDMEVESASTVSAFTWGLEIVGP